MLSVLVAVLAVAFSLTLSQMFDQVKESVLVVKALDAKVSP